MAATAQMVDFSEADKDPHEDNRPRSSKGELMTAKQVRARARRTIKKGKKLDDETFEAWAGKPIDEWDLEELARGRPRDRRGGFAGKPPAYMPRAVHERIAERFKMLIRDGMNANAVAALGVIQNLLNNEEYDEKGKPLVGANVKLDAAKWLIEHVVGKPVQPQTSDISVKLQGILGAVMVNPVLDEGHPDMAALPRGYFPGHVGQIEGAVDAEAWYEDEDEDDVRGE